MPFVASKHGTGRSSQTAANGKGSGLSGLVDLVPAHLCVLDEQGTIREANEPWRKFFENGRMLEGRFLVGDNLPAICDGLGAEGRSVANGVRELLGGRESTYTHDYMVTEGGEGRRYRIRASAIPEAAGGGVLLAHFEIAAGQAADGERRSDERLLQTQKMEAVGRLAGGMAHDFNNLLTLISGYADILLKRMPAGNPDRVEVEEIHKAANRGSGLTEQLLAFSRQEEVKPRVLDLNTLVVEMERMLRRMIGEDVQFATDLAPGLGKIRADPGQLGQVIMNLVLNARDAMPRGGRIVIQTANVDLTAIGARGRRRLSPGPYVMLAIEDSGHGMDAETLANLFEPFFTRGKEKGTGFGLSTVHRIVERCQGDIQAESQLGLGSRFTIYLPRVASESEEPPMPPKPAPSGGTETILLVEDEAGVRRLLRHVLAKEGYTVLEASSAEEAIDIYNRRPRKPDLLLTDMVMPHMNGRELADTLTAGQPGLRVLYVSGYTDDVLARSGALGQGMSFLQKPLKPQVLIAKVREVLDTPAKR